MDAKKILLIEDDFDIGEALGELLRELGHQVSVATNGALGLEKLRSNGGFDLILLDLMMPVMDGYEFRRRQLQTVELAQIPVVVISADTKAQSRIRELQPLALLGKPVSIDRLTSLIDRLQ